MSKRFVAWAVLVMLGQGLAGCGRSDSLPTPLAPTPSTLQPAPQRPLMDLTGNDMLTFEAGNSCDELPKEFRSRTYEASIGYLGPNQSGTRDYFGGELRGASFHGDGHVVVAVAANSVYLDFSDNLIIEKPAPDTYLAVAGGTGAASVEPSDLSTISASFDGFFDHCVTTSKVGTYYDYRCPADAIVHSRCTPKDSRWTLTRR